MFAWLAKLASKQPDDEKQALTKRVVDSNALVISARKAQLVGILVFAVISIATLFWLYATMHAYMVFRSNYSVRVTGYNEAVRTISSHCTTVSGKSSTRLIADMCDEARKITSMPPAMWAAHHMLEHMWADAVSPFERFCPTGWNCTQHFLRVVSKIFGQALYLALLSVFMAGMLFVMYYYTVVKSQTRVAIAESQARSSVDASADSMTPAPFTVDVRKRANAARIPESQSGIRKRASYAATTEGVMHTDKDDAKAAHVMPPVVEGLRIVPL